MEKNEGRGNEGNMSVRAWECRRREAEKRTREGTVSVQRKEQCKEREGRE